MPLLHCKECHHEWESAPMKLLGFGGQLKCDWCGCDYFEILEEKTELEKLVENKSELIKELTRMEVLL